jgi:hypothetical protein
VSGGLGWGSSSADLFPNPQPLAERGVQRQTFLEELIERTLSSKSRQMIPNRMLSGEICGNGMKGRVTTCRRRLRVNRVAQRAQVNNDAEELFLTTPVSGFHGHDAGDPPECSTLPASVVRVNNRSPFAGAETGGSETLPVAGKQEVGIT